VIRVQESYIELKTKAEEIGAVRPLIRARFSLSGLWSLVSGLWSLVSGEGGGSQPRCAYKNHPWREGRCSYRRREKRH
jgi:hypothetical protein